MASRPLRVRNSLTLNELHVKQIKMFFIQKTRWQTLIFCYASSMKIPAEHYTVYVYNKDKPVGIFNTDDYESDAFYDAMRKFEKDNRLIGSQFDVFNTTSNQWVTTIATIPAS